jgi:hypothetical protein
MKTTKFTPDYLKYLQSTAWKSKRFEAFRFHGRKCNRCQSTKRLHVHHLIYFRLGNELMSDLEVLCFRCHEAEHKRSFATFTPSPSKARKNRKPRTHKPVMLTASESRRRNGGSLPRDFLYHGGKYSEPSRAPKPKPLNIQPAPKKIRRHVPRSRPLLIGLPFIHSNFYNNPFGKQAP